MAQSHHKWPAAGLATCNAWTDFSPLVRHFTPVSLLNDVGERATKADRFRGHDTRPLHGNIVKRHGSSRRVVNFVLEGDKLFSQARSDLLFGRRQCTAASLSHFSMTYRTIPWVKMSIPAVLCPS